ncbi:MAG TPA: hypothetical protein VFV81_09215, partial [Verrucomicrobiae bacterium]|nr:hypothetical protein [Verrucomicrobiae bacterium]
VKMEKDADFNGIVDEIGTYKNGIGDTFEIKPNGSRFATQRWSFTNGVPVEIWRDGDSNGVFHEIVKYDSFFNATNRQFGDFRLLWN